MTQGTNVTRRKKRRVIDSSSSSSDDRPLIRRNVLVVDEPARLNDTNKLINGLPIEAKEVAVGDRLKLTDEPESGLGEVTARRMHGKRIEVKIKWEHIPQVWKKQFQNKKKVNESTAWWDLKAFKIEKM